MFVSFCLKYQIPRHFVGNYPLANLIIFCVCATVHGVVSDPPKSALKFKGRQSLGVSPSPTFKQINISHSPDYDEITPPYYRQRTEIESVTEEEENIPEHHRVSFIFILQSQKTLEWNSLSLDLLRSY